VPAHLPNLAVLWADTTRLGCGFTRCPGSLGSYVVCWYGPGFYTTPRYQSQAVMRSKIPRSRCQRATGDNWCAACVGTRCTACYGRPQYGQEMAPFPIRYDAAYKRVSIGDGTASVCVFGDSACSSHRPPLLPSLLQCVSACSPSKMPRCGVCTAKQTCVACKSGWQFAAGTKKCTVRAAQVKSRRRLKSRRGISPAVVIPPL
jgi:hypothetical protein